MSPETSSSGSDGGEAEVLDEITHDEDRKTRPIFKEFSRALSARVQYESLGFGQVDAKLVFEAMDRSLEDIKRHDRLLGASSIDLSLSIGSALSAGFVTWVLRSGALMSALISTMPVWRGFDPLIILGSTGSVAVAKLPKRTEETEELSNTERVFDHATKLRKEGAS